MLRDRNVYVGVFLIGIESQKFVQGIEKLEVKACITALIQHRRDKKIIFGVDRLSYIKGILPEFNAPESFLSKHTEWVGKPVMIRAVIPSREDVNWRVTCTSRLSE